MSVDADLDAVVVDTAEIEDFLKDDFTTPEEPASESTGDDDGKTAAVKEDTVVDEGSAPDKDAAPVKGDEDGEHSTEGAVDTSKDPVLTVPGKVADPDPTPTPTPTADPKIAELEAKIATLTESLRSVTAVKEPESVLTAPKVAASDIDINKVLEGIDLDEALGSNEGFMEVLAKVMRATVDYTRSQVTSDISTQTTLKESVTKFYNDNKDLLPVRNYVGQIASSVTSEHPEFTIAQVLEESRNIVRSTLNLPEIVVPATEPGPGDPAPVASKDRKKPVLPGSGNATRKSTPKGSKLEEEIADFLSD